MILAALGGLVIDGLILLGIGFLYGYMAGDLAAMERAAKQRDELRRAQGGQF